MGFSILVPKLDDFRIDNKIGMTGFEPAASCTQNKRATELRYIPIFIVIGITNMKLADPIRL